MIPRIATGGRSFAGSWAYYGHDKGKSTRERVEWTHTENMITADPDKAIKVMAYTALEQARLKEASGQVHTGRKLEKPVFSYSLAWHPEQNPTKEHMLETAMKSVKALGLEEHETLVVAHRDEPQKHVHVIINRVHPETGLAGDIRNSKRKLSAFAREYERENGKIYCQQREENHQKREQGENVMYREPGIAEAWQTSDSGAGFRAALEDRGFQLAQGRKCVVVVDQHGNIFNPVRHIEGIRSRDMKARLSQLDLSRLPDANELSHEIKNGSRRRDEGERQQTPEQATVRDINRLQDQQHEEYAELSSRHHRRIDTERTRLEEFHQIPDREQTVRDLTGKAEKTGWWRGLLGISRKNQEKLNAAKLTLADARERIQERVGFLERDRDRALLSLSERHTVERKLLLEFGPKALESFRNPAQPEREHTATRHRNEPKFTP